MFHRVFAHQVQQGDRVSIPDIILSNQHCPSEMRSVQRLPDGRIELVYIVEHYWKREFERILDPDARVYRFIEVSQDLLRIGDVVSFVGMLTNLWKIHSLPGENRIMVVSKTRLREEETWRQKPVYDFPLDNLIIPSGLQGRRDRSPIFLPPCTQLPLL